MLPVSSSHRLRPMEGGAKGPDALYSDFPTESRNTLSTQPSRAGLRSRKHMAAGSK